jgi:hypothetical protein
MKRTVLFLLAAALLAPGPTLMASEPVQHELLVFGSGELTGTSGVDTPNDIDDVRVAADILFSVQRGSLKLFGEYLLANHERDLERFQVGWEPSEHSVIWFGRFHQASSVWNHQHHHGQFLQTSITRPAAEEWEDAGGSIPQHFVGVLTESNWRAGKHSGILMAVGGGLAPVLTPEGLEPLDLLTLDTRRHKLGFQARVAWLPDELEDTSFGLLVAHNEIAWRGPRDASPPDFDHIDQSVIGVYANLDSGSWKLHAAVYRIEAAFDEVSENGRGDDFFTGYAQVERALPHGLDVFARYEDSSDSGASGYLRLFPNFAQQRSSLGARWQFARKHALSFQASSTRTMSDRYRELRLQWSAALL